VGQDKQRRYMRKRTGKRFSLTQGQGHDERIREVLQVCTMYMIAFYQVGKKNLNVVIYLQYGTMIICAYISGIPSNDWFLFFCRLKINHDSHEFILEFGTVANNNSKTI
jgi:hypothetical protein